MTRVFVDSLVAVVSGAFSILSAPLGVTAHTISSTSTGSDPIEETVQNRVATTNATVTTLHTFTIPASTAVAVNVKVIARRTGGSAGAAEDAGFYIFQGLFKNVAGTVSQIGALLSNSSVESQAGWDCTMDVTGATARVRVTGATNNNITWHMTAKVYSVST